MRHPLRRVSLQGWLVAAFVAVGAVTSLGVLLVLLPRVESTVRSERLKETHREITSAYFREVGIFKEELADGDVTLAQNFAENLNFSLGSGEVRVYRVDGTRPRLVASYPPGESRFLPRGISADVRGIAGGSTEPTVSAVDTVRGRAVARITAEVPGSTLPSGVVEVAVPVRNAPGDIGALRARVFLAVAAVLGLASLVGFAISRLLSRRIGRLARTASALTSGDLTARAPETSPRELATLGDGLNRMATRIEELVHEATGERDRIRDLIVSLDEGLLALGTDGEIVVANPAAVRYLGEAVAEDGARLDSLPPGVADAVRPFLADPDADTAVEEVTLDNGLVLLLSVARLNRAAGLVMTLRDVTHERRLDQARRDLVANVSHELKTPLTALKGFLELIEDENMSADRRREFVGHMTQEAQRLESLVEEQLELARLDAGALPLERTDVDLGDIAEGIAESRYLLFARRGVALNCRLGGRAPYLAAADPARIEQILLILLDNALRHTPQGGRVELRVERSDEHVTLAVADTGEGIPAEALPFLFDRFYRADPSREGRGAGLGLAIARGLAAAHGGGIEVESRLGEGSTFTVSISSEVAEPTPARPQAGVR